MNHAMRTSGVTSDAVAAALGATGAKKAGDVDSATGKKVLYWHDRMVPGQKFDRPGKSPFMDMHLVPSTPTAAATRARSPSVHRCSRISAYARQRSSRGRFVGSRGRRQRGL